MKYYNFKAKNNMNCAVKLFAAKDIYEQIEKTALQQLFNASKLPGIVGVVGLPDIHQGYGLPIGGVMASDLKQGIISPGAVGFDINCGVRLLTTGIQSSQIKDRLDHILNHLKLEFPAGLGVNSKLRFSKNNFNNIIEKGLPYLINKLGYGLAEDINNCEDQGHFQQANLNKVSKKAQERGYKQLGTLGSGNHFIEIQEVIKTFTSDNYSDNNFKPGQLVFMLHTGSRGFGHQIASDYINLAKQNNHRYQFDLPTKNLASFPIQSQEGKDYYQAMACAANFAYANRQILTHQLRNLIKEIIPDIELSLYYDLTHNIARKEVHNIENDQQKLLIHRKGATRLASGDLALIPGSMGSGSYIVKAAGSKANSLSFNSVAHGAGRKMGRREARRKLNHNRHQTSMGNVKAISSSNSNLLDESPLAYKDIDLVIESLIKTELAQPLVKMKPLAVLKG